MVRVRNLSLVERVCNRVRKPLLFSGADHIAFKAWRMVGHFLVYSMRLALFET